MKRKNKKDKYKSPFEKYNMVCSSGKPKFKGYGYNKVRINKKKERKEK